MRHSFIFFCSIKLEFVSLKRRRKKSLSVDNYTKESCRKKQILTYSIIWVKSFSSSVLLRVGKKNLITHRESKENWSPRFYVIYIHIKNWRSFVDMLTVISSADEYLQRRKKNQLIFTLDQRVEAFSRCYFLR